MLGRAMARRHHSDAAVPTARGRGWPDMLGGVAALAAVLGAATLRAALQTNSDVAWLLTVGEKVLDGQRLYVDVIETNPPASVLVYVPAIALGRLLGIAPERMLDAQIFFGVLLSLALTWLVLAPVWPPRPALSSYCRATTSASASTSLSSAFCQRSPRRQRVPVASPLDDRSPSRPASGWA
jgi:hypothetical protein